MKLTPLALVAGRLLAILGAALVLLALTWPWMTLRAGSSSGLVEEFRFSLSGSDITALAATNVALAPKLVDAIDEIVRVNPFARSDLSSFRQQFEQEQRTGAQISAWVAALWVPPIVALVLALVLLITNGELRFRRGFGAALVLIALASAIVIILTRLRIDGALAQLRAIPALSDMFDSFDRTGFEISLRTESGATSAALFAGLISLGGLVELILPLPALAAHKAAPAEAPSAAPLLQTAGAPMNIPALAPAPIVESAGDRRPCVQCGKSLSVGTKFCGGCGARQD